LSEPSRGSAGKSGDDFVGEMVGEFEYVRVGGSATLDLADDASLRLLRT